MANDEPSPAPGAGRHLLVLGCAYLLGVPAYLLDHGLPWRPPPPGSTGSNWITLPGVFFFATMAFVSVFAVVSSLVWVRRRRQSRPMSVAAYLFSVFTTVALAGGLWVLALID